MGVVGGGGAGFPTHIKVSNQCDTCIANGLECEPLLFNDKYLMVKNTNKYIFLSKKAKKFLEEYLRKNLKKCFKIFHLKIVIAPSSLIY